jgi:hypothetical protein
MLHRRRLKVGGPPDNLRWAILRYGKPYVGIQFSIAIKFNKLVSIAAQPEFSDKRFPAAGFSRITRENANYAQKHAQMRG